MHDWGDEHDGKEIICSNSDDNHPNKEDTSPMALVDPEELVGFLDNVGHALTFAILTKDTNKIICRYEVCTAADTNHPNF